MVKDSKHFRRNSTPIGNNENKSSHPLEPPPNHLDPDPTRPPLNQIQEPLQNPIPISRRKPESTTTPSKTAPFRTPEKQFSTSSRNRFGWVPNSTTGTDISEETNHHHVPPQLPPLNRYGTITPRNYKYSIGKASSVHSDSSSTHSTPSKSVTKPAYLLSGSRPPVSVGNRVGFTKGLPIYPGPITIVDSPTVPHFELREDPSFWLDHNVQVVIRVRPLNGNERTMFGYNRCLKQDTCQNITWIGQPETRFVFDYVACETINQEMLFRVAGLPMVENCISGYNSCMFAYGQTGSGKTHTMLGEISDLNVKPSQDRGMTPRIFEFLFARIRAEEESRRDEKLRYNCKCSFLEIYNEQITDLLDPSSTNLLIREDVHKGVYVENLTEFQVGSVDDILTLIIQGSANRRVAATNMNRESSRSHSVFTCVIESTWEKDSTTNFRFARLNLVDLAGSERQKTSGAEGERLKEAASINKSLSTLGHVIMVLSDLANGKQRHVPYRDSRLTFLLQDSLGGNSKTMIIANISPSMCSANETLSTLKFAQRARLIQNNAIVNEDMSGDVQALQHQIRLLKEELASIKRQNSERHTPNTILEMEEEFDEMASISSSINSIRISNKQWKSLEVTLVGALRRERTAETTIKQLEAEIEQLNRLVRQREEDTRCTKMMLKFREEKINRMEALVKGEITSESYLSEDNTAKSKEIDLLRSKLERNPEVTRFALENIRLLDQLRRYQDFYEEGERDLMINEISQMRNQLIQLLDGKPEMDQQLCSEIQNQENKNAQIGNSNGDKESFPYELRKTSEELERCRNDLQACLEMNAKLTREISDLQTEISTTKSTQYEQCSIEEKFSKSDHEETIKHAEEILNYQLESDILKSILEEHKSANSQAQQNFLDLQTNLKSTKTELNIAKSVIEALESQNIELINELDEERFNSSKIFKKTEPKRNSSRSLENEDSPLNAKLRKMQASLDKVRNLKHGADSSVEREMDEVRKQVEIETAEVIVCLQEEINSFEEQIEASNARIKVLESEKVDLEREREERERDWEGFADELEIALSNGNLALEEAFEQVATISGTFSQKERVELQVGNLIRGICERDDVIEELNKCFEDAQNVRSDLEWKLRSLRGATLAITDAHQQEKSEKGREICSLKEEREKIYDELVRSCLEKEVLIKCVGSVQSESVLKFQEMEMEFQMREMEFESRIQEERREKEREVGLLGEEMSRLSDELVRFSVEKEVVVESLVSRIQEERREKKREVGLLGEEISRLSDELVRFSVEKEVVVKSLVSVQSESELKIQEMESRFVCDQRQSQNSFQCLASQVLKLDGEICSLKEERESLYDESVRSFVEKDVLLKYFGLVQSELDLKFQEIESDFQLREVEKSEKLREVCSLREERDDESVQSFIEKDVLMKCFSLVQTESNLKFRKIESEFQMREMDFESRIREEKSEKERDICSLREERDDESVRSFIEKDVLLKYFVLVQSELDLKFQEIKLEFETRIREEKREKERELCSLREERDDELVRSFIEKDMLMKCFSLVQTGSSLKFQNIESEVQMRELEFESRIQEVQREKQREISSLREEMSGLSDELVRFFIEKEVLVESLISTQSESELKIQELESRTENDQKQNQSSFECLASQVLRMERDIGDKEKNYEIKMQDMQNKLLGLENSVIVTNESWYKQKEALENELNDAKSLSAEKTFEASNLMSKIEETQETIKDADNTVNALIRVNETLKREIERCRQTETLISNEKTALQIQIETLNSSLCAKEREYEIICDLVADLENFVRELQSSVLDNFEIISCDVDQVKSEFKGCVNLARNLLGETWLEIIRKDCAISVLNLCQMGRIVERVTGLTLQNGFLQNGICESNSLISNLRENNLKAKSEIELYSVIKGKLLADITHSFNRISNKEEETNEMKMKFELFEKKILELQLQEEMMLERYNCMYNELANLANEIDNVKKCELSNERERISRVFDEMEMVMVLSMIDLNLSFEENEMMENELSEMKGNYDKLLEENSGLRDLIYSSNLHIETLKEEIMQKNSQLEEAKSEDIASKTVLIDSVLTRSERIFNSMDANIEFMSHKAEKDVIEQIDMVSKFECEVELLETLFEKLKAENCSLQSELNRRDEIANGLLFDLKLLQEASSRAKDEKEIEIENLNNELETLNTQLDELNGQIETLFSSIEERDCTIETLQCENSELKSQIENLNCARDEIEAELDEKTGVIEKLEEELIKIQNLVYEKEGLIAELQNEINRIKGDFDLANSHCEENKGLIEELVNEINKLEGNFDMANALAKENEAIASEARQIAEEKKVYAQEKEEEVKLLENSIEELESTIYALESKVDLVKEDAEKQRIKRELIEAELQQLRKQLGNNCSIDAKNQILDLKRNLELLEKELSEKEAEISQCKGHISELNMHAEAQAREYKQRFKELEAMGQQVQQVKSIESNGSNGSNGSVGQPNNAKTNRGSSSPFKGNRGSGSPFKCMGLGMIQQMYSEKDEDLVALKRQIEELESLASSRQKEIFMLNTRLAAAESMTHDVIRDLLGVKMDMSSYASLLDNRHKLTLDETNLSDDHQRTQEQEEEIKRLKKRLNEFIEERQGWIEEINQRQNEMMKARVSAEKLKQREQLLLTEYEMLKCENENYKNRIVQLEDEIQRVPPSQHSLHLRIHHHAKTKDENNLLRKKNEDLSAKLQKTEGILARVRDELAKYKVSNGKDPYFENEDGDQLRIQLQESEEDRLKLAEKLLNLCTSVLKVAGVTANAEMDANPTAAESAVDRIRDRITSLEDEVHDLKLKCKLQREKERLAELRWESSPLRVRLKDSTCGSPNVSLS